MPKYLQSFYLDLAVSAVLFIFILKNIYDYYYYFGENFRNIEKEAYNHKLYNISLTIAFTIS
jgi:hypothetical protein